MSGLVPSVCFTTTWMERPLDGEVVSTGQKRQLIHRGSPQAKAEMSDSPCVSQQAAADTGQFDCNICLDMAYEPVVTACGHLYWCLCPALRVAATSGVRPHHPNITLSGV